MSSQKKTERLKNMILKLWFGNLFPVFDNCGSIWIQVCMSILRVQKSKCGTTKMSSMVNNTPAKYKTRHIESDQPVQCLLRREMNHGEKDDRKAAVWMIHGEGSHHTKNAPACSDCHRSGQTICLLQNRKQRCHNAGTEVKCAKIFFAQSSYHRSYEGV